MINIIIIIIIRFVKRLPLASEALAAGQSWVLLKSLTEEVRLKPRFKGRKWVSTDYWLRQQVPGSWRRTTKSSSCEVCPGELVLVVGPQTSEVSVHWCEPWCDDWDISVLWRCCGCWRSTEPSCTQFFVEWTTNAAHAVMAGHEIVLELAERSWLHCFALAVEPECCWLEHRGITYGIISDRQSVIIYNWSSIRYLW